MRRVRQRPYVTQDELAGRLDLRRPLEQLTEVVCGHIAEDVRIPPERRLEALELKLAWERVRRWEL